MTEYNSIESMFPSFYKKILEKFNSNLKKFPEFDYIEKMCHIELHILTNFDMMYQIAFKNILDIYKNFNSYVLDFIFCILYYNNIFNKDNLIKCLIIFNDDLDYIKSKTGSDIGLLDCNENNFTIYTNYSTKVFSYDIFNYNLPLTI